MNFNGQQEAGETALVGVTVFNDLDQDCVVGPNDPTAITDADGNYEVAAFEGINQIGVVAPTDFELGNGDEEVERVFLLNHQW